MTQPPVPPSDITDTWRARGKFSYRSEDSSESGNFDWQQIQSDYSVRFFGPLGLGAVRIQGNNDQISIRSSKAQQSSDNPSALVYQMTGMEIPITEIPDWLLAKPNTERASNLVYDADGLLAQATINDWQINYLEYYEQRNLPKKIVATREGVKLTLVVNAWRG